MKTILVTGASKGIGFETALTLLELGHTVIAVARTEEKLENLNKRSKNGNLHILAADITDEKDLKSIKESVSNIGSLDCLINNAGMVLNKPFMETSREDWQSVFDVNFFAPIELIIALKPYFTKGSHIVNIGSMGGFQGSDKFPGLAAYSSAKGALAILSESLSTELAKDGISVNCLCLGAVQTEMLAEAFPGYEAPVKPKDMGNYISDFTLTANKFINGKVIPISLNNPE